MSEREYAADNAARDGRIESSTDGTAIRDTIGSRGYRNESVLRHLYYEDGLTQREIAAEFDVSERTVWRWMNKHGIQRRGPDHYRLPSPSDASYPYPFIWMDDCGVDRLVYEHQLVALAAGADPENLFGGAWEVHHRLPLPQLNLPENVEVLPKSEHQNITHPTEAEVPDAAETADTLDEIGFEQSGVPLDALDVTPAGYLDVSDNGGDADG